MRTRPREHRRRLRLAPCPEGRVLAARVEGRPWPKPAALGHPRGVRRLAGEDDGLELVRRRGRARLGSTVEGLDAPVGSLSDYRQWLDRLSESRNPLRFTLDVPPSETARGSLVFYVNRAVSDFTITYHGTTTALSL